MDEPTDREDTIAGLSYPDLDDDDGASDRRPARRVRSGNPLADPQFMLGVGVAAAGVFVVLVIMRRRMATVTAGVSDPGTPRPCRCCGQLVAFVDGQWQPVGQPVGQQHSELSRPVGPVPVEVVPSPVPAADHGPAAPTGPASAPLASPVLPSPLAAGAVGTNGAKPDSVEVVSPLAVWLREHPEAWRLRADGNVELLAEPPAELFAGD